MRFLIAVILIALCSAAAEYFLPWWTMAVMSFLVAFALRPPKAFMCGFLGIAVLWLIAAMFKDIPNEHILSRRMAVLFHLPGYGLFMLVTVLLGALIGGTAAAAGALFRSAGKRKYRY
jgi:hypothetical protein